MEISEEDRKEVEELREKYGPEELSTSWQLRLLLKYTVWST